MTIMVLFKFRDYNISIFKYYYYYIVKDSKRKRVEYYYE